MEGIICITVLVPWLLMLLTWLKFLEEIFISIIKKEFNLRDTLMVFVCLTIMTVYILWLGIQLLS
jgi:hypothetical protein